MMPRTVRILGLDPGLRLTGYALLRVQRSEVVLEEAGLLRATGRSLPERLRSLYCGLAEILQQFRPDVLAIEELFAHSGHPRTALLMAHARGALLLAAAEHGLSCVSYPPAQIKKTITGAGRASKLQIQRTMQRELGLHRLPEPPDVADALAVALCHYHLDLRRAC